MRQGEVLALKWEDVNFEAGVLQVRRTLSTATGGGYTFSVPKTAKGRRSIKLPNTALSSLKKHRKAQLEERMKFGELFADQGLVFTSRVGTPISRQDLTNISPRPHYPLLQAPSQTDRPAGHSFPRLEAYLCHPATS
jgi:integrase